MGETTTGGERAAQAAEEAAQQSRQRRTEKSTYVLQVRQQTGGDEGAVTWSDVATVEVPANTRRKTAIKRALAAWAGSVEGGITVRLLDADSAEEVPVRPKPPEAPQLEIG